MPAVGAAPDRIACVEGVRATPCTTTRAGFAFVTTAAPRVGALAPVTAGAGGGGSFAGAGATTAAASAGCVGSEIDAGVSRDVVTFACDVSVDGVTGVASCAVGAFGDWRAVNARMEKPAAMPTAAKVTMTANALPH